MEYSVNFLLRSKSDSNDLLSSEKRSPFLYEKISVDIRHKQDEAPETGAAVSYVSFYSLPPCK